jgi:hypothetical protein
MSLSSAFIVAVHEADSIGVDFAELGSERSVKLGNARVLDLGRNVLGAVVRGVLGRLSGLSIDISDAFGG